MGTEVCVPFNLLRVLIYDINLMLGAIASNKNLHNIHHIGMPWLSSLTFTWEINVFRASTF